MKLIDAEQLRTELKMLRRRYGYNELWDLSCYQAELGLARVGLIDEILSLLNTLEETSDNWKPSEEQMEALYTAAREAPIIKENGNYLYDLYDHLKELI